MTTRRISGGRRPATMQDVADAAQVSSMTVSNVFRHPDRVQKYTRLKVLQAAHDLGYVPNMSAGSLAAGRSVVIGATVPSIRNSSFYRYVTGLQDGCRAHDHKLILMLADTQAEEREAVETFIGLRAAGIILIGDNHDATTVDLLLKSSVPLVESWLYGEALDMAVGYDIADAMRAACRHHMAAGRTRIGLIGHDNFGTRRFMERLPAFRGEMRKAGLRDDLVVEVAEPHSFESGPAALDALLELDAGLDAVICPTDVVAASILFECSRRGLAVPHDLGVIGWGDYEIASTLSPRLTTIRPSPWEMGKRSVDLLMNRHDATTAVDIGFELIVRESA